MSSRLNLQRILEEYTPNVYFQPPEGVRMTYPAIRYSLSRITNTQADNVVYKQDHMYSITVISKDPEEPIVALISKTPNIRFDRQYQSDGLYHNVFSLYFDE